MKNLLLISLALIGIVNTTGQQLSTGNTDVVGMDWYPFSPHMVEADAQSFYWISGSSYAMVDHPLLTDLISDFQHIFFIKYDQNGVALKSNFIRGIDYPRSVSSFKGGLTIMSQAYEDVDADGNVVPLDGASHVEFIANYDSECKLEKIVNIWKLTQNQFVSSAAQMDSQDGSVFIYGTGDEPMELDGYGVLGKDLPGQYLYLIKYSHDLQIKWVYAAGFDAADTISGYFYQLKVHPDLHGNVLITGNYESNSSPLIKDKVLQKYDNGYGLFAVKLDANGRPVWVKEGPMKGYGYDTQIFKGFGLTNGDMILAGATTTGYFKLGDAEINFVNGSGSVNQFVYRITPAGKVKWIRTFQNMGYNQVDTKKGTESVEIMEEVLYDAVLWEERVLYMTGSFQDMTFQVADRILQKNYPNGIFLAAVDLETGAELWGYSLSSEFTRIFGIDNDRTGNVTLMGYTTQAQDFEGIGEVPVAATDVVFHVGLDYKGAVLWHNNAHLLNGPFYSLSGVDLEVLPNGEVFSSMYMTQADNLEIGKSSLRAEFPYTSWLVKLQAEMELGGKVLDESGNPVYPGYVRAYKSARSGAYPVVDSTLLDEAGVYKFEGLYPGNYALQVVPDATQYVDGIPTYFGDKAEWRTARFNDFKTDTKATFMDITLGRVKELTSVDGAGSVSGNVSYEDQGVLKATMGRPVPKAAVILLKKAQKKTTASGDVVAYIETDEFGNFSFNNIPDGEYILIVNITGLEMLEVHEVTIINDLIAEGLDYTVSDDGIYTYTGVGIPLTKTESLSIYPNPGNGLIFIDLPSSGDYTISIFSTDGRLVGQSKFHSSGGLRTLDISPEKEGIYLLNIEGPGTKTTIKYIKK